MSNSEIPTWETPPDSITLNDSQIHVWLFDLNLDERTIADLKKVLPDSELKKVEKITAQNVQKQYIASHGVMRKILSMYTHTPAKNLDFITGNHGKPSLQTPNEHICFNLSHSLEYGVLAIALNSELGIDIENTKRNVDEIKLSERFFTTTEAKTIKEMDADKIKSAFFHAWTRKEALLKATGKGISYGLNKFQVTMRPDEDVKIISTSNIYDNNQWTLLVLPEIDNYVSALAVENKKWELRCWKWIDN